MTLQDLLEIYAENQNMTKEWTKAEFETGLINKQDLLKAYLEYEGIFGYEQDLMCIFEILQTIED